MTDDDRASADRRLQRLAGQVAACHRCPRLIGYIRLVAQQRRRAYAGQEYWGRPVPGFGDPQAGVVLIGLAPGAHGANRTGRMFTGDGEDGRGASDFLAAALHAEGAASQPTSRAMGDGYTLSGVYLTAICRCAPPFNRPARSEIDTCGRFLHRELDVIGPRVLVALGRLSWDQSLRILEDRGAELPRPRPRFGHGARYDPGEGLPLLLGAYHPSRQNTSTGLLTQAMLRDVLRQALEAAKRGS